MNITSSIRRLSLVFMALFIAASVGLVYWQVVVAQQVASNAILTLPRKCLPDATAKRGRIFDRNGVLLAYSELIPVNTNNPNVGNLCVYQRVYTHPSMAPVIGYYVSSTFCAETPFCEAGVEKQFDDYLSGSVGVTGLNNTVNKALHVPTVGDDIYLTIDVRIQDLLQKDFPIESTGASVFPTDRGSVIVSDPHTGEILGMYSNPTYDSNRIASGDLDYLSSLLKDPKQPLLNRAINSCYVPGSVYKTVSLMAGLDSGKFTLDTPFYDDNDPNHLQARIVRLGEGDNTETFGPVGNNIDGYTHNFPVSTFYGFSHSDNIIFAQVGVHTGAQTWLDYNHALYVGKQIPFDLPVNVSTVTPQPQKNLCATTPPPDTSLSVVQLAENAFGQGVDFITPLQMTLVDNVAANDGQLMRPTLIEKIVDPSQSVLKSFSATSLGNPISQQTASEVRDSMYGVVSCGSGSLTRVQLTYPYVPWSVIGKTGTGQVNGTGTPAESWFITAAPYTYQSNEKPAITIVAMKENGGEGAFATGPMLRALYNSIFSQGLVKAQQSPQPDPNFCVNVGLLGH
ncbi:MAG TPA: penicillin-binding transpeptidase domain-containing protein [Ktedonobacteraceae bacterium]|nr:penicillin-binding transpeptidase domain-containing protein [Ktedonobacteraceae bacterium]